MKHFRWLLLALTLLPLLGLAESPADEAAYEAQIQAAEKRIPKVLTQYATSIGCNLAFSQKNVVPYKVDGINSLVALISLDNGCTGGTAMNRPVFVVLQHGSGTSMIVNAAFSAPHQTSSQFPAQLTELFIKNGELWFRGKELDPEKDSLCCPSVSVSGRVIFKNNIWQRLRSR